MMDEVRRQAGWYRNPVGAGMRFWDGSAWTEDVRPGHPVRPRTSLLPHARIVRGFVGAVGLLLLVLAVQAWRAGIEQGWGDGSFALVAYFGAVCFALGALLCGWLALGRRKSS